MFGPMNRDVFQTVQVFTPTMPARISFVERDLVNEKLVNALSTPGKQIVVYGHSGTGKTTLLDNKLNQIYSGHITVRCMKGSTVDELKLQAFDLLNEYFVLETGNSTKSNRDSNIEASYLAIKVQLKESVSVEHGQKSIRIVPVQLTAQNLATFLGTKGLCLVIQDFHKVDTEEKVKLSQLMKVFMDCAVDYPSVKIIAIGAVETARQVVEYDPEMRNRVSEIHVDLMTEVELLAIIEKGTRALNLIFPDNVKKAIAKYSSGLGAVCHQLCLNLCNAAGILQTASVEVHITQEHLEKAVSSYVEDCSDSIRNNFEKAMKVARKLAVNHADVILNSLSHFEDLGTDRHKLLQQIQKDSPSYTDGVLKKQLQTLKTETKGGLIKHNENSGLYSFANPIYRAYALSLFHKTNSKYRQDAADSLTLPDLLRLLEKQLRAVSVRNITPVRVGRTN